MLAWICVGTSGNDSADRAIKRLKSSTFNVLNIMLVHCIIYSSWIWGFQIERGIDRRCRRQDAPRKLYYKWLYRRWVQYYAQEWCEFEFSQRVSSISYFIRMKNLCKASHSFGNQYPAFDHVISLSSLKFRKQQFHRVHEFVARTQDQHIHWTVNREYETQTYDLQCFNYNVHFRTFM